MIGSFVRCCVVLVIFLLANQFSSKPVDAATVPLPTGEINKYLIIGMGPSSDGDAIDIDNAELGSHKAGAPLDSGFTSGGSTFGPNLLGNVPNIPFVPTNALPVIGGIASDGNMALTDSTGKITTQNVGVYADLGIHAAEDAVNAIGTGGLSSTFYYDEAFTDVTDSNGFPNTLTSFTAANPGANGHNNTSATGVNVPTGTVDSSYNLADGNGLTGDVDLSALNAELAAVKAAIPMLNAVDNGNVSFGVIDLKLSSGLIDKSMHPTDKDFGVSGDITASASSASDGGTFTVTLTNTGLTVIDFDVDSGEDVTVSNYNFVIDGPVGSSALFRVPDGSSFLTSQGNVLAGAEGIGLNSIIIATLDDTNDTQFSIQNSVINGIAMWSLMMAGGDIDIDNAQGCAQFVADTVDMSNARFTHCGSGPHLNPEPTSLVLVFLAVVGFCVPRRRSI